VPDYGWLGLYLSRQGAQLRGFDLSQPAIATANKAAKRYGTSTEVIVDLQK
jgi:tRNA/tmRNA/rRNA uracil-C5-methylase (TrmA/RlmC/RlmD family)